MFVNTARSTQPAIQAGSQQNLGTKDIFLKILVAQMRNQDPLKPQDAAKMSSQLAQFNMVEQQIDTNKFLKEMAASSKSRGSDISSAASYLGHTATAKVASFGFDGTSPLQLDVELKQDAAGATVQVLDRSGRVIKTLYHGFLTSGSNKLTWQGDSDSGVNASPGEYSLQVVTADKNGHPAAANTRITGQVGAVRLTPDGVFAVIGKTPVAVANITEIQ